MRFPLAAANRPLHSAMATTGHGQHGCLCQHSSFQLLCSFMYQAIFQYRAGEDLERSFSPSPALRRIADNQPLPDRCLSCSFLKTSHDRDS